MNQSTQVISTFPNAENLLINRHKALTQLINMPLDYDQETIQRAIEVISNLPIEAILMT